MTPGNSRPLPYSPRRRTGSTSSDDDDMISNLPDSILQHILSFLPTKNAVATGVLSQRWKFLWTAVINLDFSFPDAYAYEEKPHLKITEFVQFVNYVLLHHKRGCLNKLSILWHEGFIPFYVNAWISAALTSNVHELSVLVEDCDLQIQVQKSLFSCQELQSLQLYCKIHVSPAVVFSLPKLEKLTLISVYFPCVEAFSKILASCPMLKYLYIYMAADVVEYFMYDTIDTIHTQVPRNMFSCERLQSLELNYGNICICPENVIPLPKVESLKLHSVYFQCEESFRKLIASCPVLKYLYIDTDFRNHHDRNGAREFRYIVSSDSLRRLELYVHEGKSDFDEYSDEEGTSLCSVELSAPSLVYIKFEDQISSIVILESPSSLVEANIKLAALKSRHEHDYCNLFVEAFRAFHCAQTLTLSSHVIRALSCATVNLKTRFKRLSKLEVKIGPCCWSSLQDFIELSDNLEVLTVNKEDNCMNEDHHSSSKWENPNQVPSCLSNSLETFSFDAYDGSDDRLPSKAWKW